MNRGVQFVTGAMLSANILAGCSSAPAPEAGPPNYPDIETMHVACVDVSGLPPFTEESCAQLATQVEAGMRLFSKATNDIIKPPRVTHQYYPEDIIIQDAAAKRCIPIGDKTTNEDFKRLNTFNEDIVNGALKYIKVDNRMGLYVGVNSSVSLCGKDPNATPPQALPNKRTEHCPQKSEVPTSYPGGFAMRQYNKPVIFSFAELPPTKELVISDAHERGHLGRGQVRLGHEFILCNTGGDTIPSFIGKNMGGLALDQTSWKGSIMSYGGASEYITPPQLAYLDVMKSDQILSSPNSGTFTLRSVEQRGPAAIRLPLSSPAIKKVIEPQIFPGSKVSANDYDIWLAKMPETAAVGVYAAPATDKNKAAPLTFLLDTIEPSQELTIEGDVKISNVQVSGDSAKFDLLRPSSPFQK